MAREQEARAARVLTLPVVVEELEVAEVQVKTLQQSQTEETVLRSTELCMLVAAAQEQDREVVTHIKTLV
jgi:hypothetical protein